MAILLLSCGVLVDVDVNVLFTGVGVLLSVTIGDVSATVLSFVVGVLTKVVLCIWVVVPINMRNISEMIFKL